MERGAVGIGGYEMGGDGEHDDGDGGAGGDTRRRGLMQWRDDKEGRLMVCTYLIGLWSVRSSVHLYTFQMPESMKIGGLGFAGAKRRDVVMDIETEAAAQLFCGSIQEILDESGQPKRLLIIVNPLASDKSGKRVYKTSLEPILKTAKISITMEEAWSG